MAHRTTNILSRGREIESLSKEIAELNKKIKMIAEEKEKYESSVSQTLMDYSVLERELQECDIVYATEKQKLQSVEETVAKLESKLQKLREELGGVDRNKEECKTSKLTAEGNIANLDEEITKLQNAVDEFFNENKDNQKYIDDLNFDITNLKISVSSFDESELSINEFIERIESEINTSNLSMQNKEAIKIQFSTDNGLLENGNLELLQKIEQIKEELKNSGSKIEDLKSSRIEKNKELEKAEEDILMQIDLMQNLKEQVVKTDVKKSKISFDIEQIINKMWEEYELTPNNASEFERPKNVAAASKEVNSLRNQIKGLGSINIDAIEEYKQTRERYDFLCEQRLDLENTGTKLKKLIFDMTSTMKEKFETQFKLINKNFKEVFSDLFGGGKAELKITDMNNVLESGIEIEAQPPGKKLQNMMLLSGGEKALTAIALLFAILKLNPAPFCVLDEIEAALDDINVYRFADYLKRFTSEIQFLVITHRKRYYGGVGHGLWCYYGGKRNFKINFNET